MQNCHGFKINLKIELNVQKECDTLEQGEKKIMKK